MNIITVGLDLAKSVFHVVCFNDHFKEVKKRMLRRNQVLQFFAQLPPSRVGMEACASSHYWGRELRALGHEVKLVPPQYVKPYLRGNKNDYNDARAIAEAATRPSMPFVAIKTVAEQDMQAIHRMRAQCIRDRTALSNSTRGLLGEFGIVLPKGLTTLRKSIPGLLEDAENGLSDRFRNLLVRRYEQLVELDEHIAFYTNELVVLSQQDDACQRLQTVPGFGPIVSSAFRSAIGDGRAYGHGRAASASLGLVPRQHSSGGKDNLLGISKRGDRYLRSLLVHGARAVVVQAARKDDPLSRWINRIRKERGWNKAVVAMANKLARIGWAILRYNTIYQPVSAASRH
ncbi:IS110 family transposase [Geothermobacter hydrogeniphilus]|uniref:IS110 family transposase n=1 Tax=Geothermobacter hydrogeniphilus TaxID=1969733 RepID=A0A2K2HBL0_9BACT|nr:IS110 family transposase [Geothermobacter hydrogeniphilus]PNU20651.1 IS110 family transposase [Geothermobacter hydrogeniphilus]